MKVRVRLFGFLAEEAGRDHLVLELEEGATYGELLARARRELRIPPGVRVAAGTDYARATDPVRSGRVALIPPVAGG